MNICVAGDVHGRLCKFYESVKNFESGLKLSFDVVLQAGDFGIWIDGKHHDGITKIHNGTGDFPDWYKRKKAVPVRTYFINGNNEDFNFLNGLKISGNLEILKNLFYIPNGTTAEISPESGNDAENLIVAGIGGKYDPEHIKLPESDRFYTRQEINNLIKYADENKSDKDKRIDILISHDAPEGVLIEDNDKNRYYPKAAGLRELILKVRPKMVFFGHHHGICQSEIEGIPVYGLNILGKKGSLLFVRMKRGLDGEEKYFEKPVVK